MADATSSPNEALAVIGRPVLEAADLAAPRKRLGIATWFAIFWMSVVLIVAIIGPWLPLDLSSNNPSALAPGQGGHLLGTDKVGHDLLSQILQGTQATMLVGIGSVIIGVLIGGFLGLVAGYFKGRFTGALGSLFDILLAYPPLVLALTLVSVFANEQDTTTLRRDLVVLIGIGIVSIPILARITRANTLVWSEREFVTAARAMGANKWRILFRDVLPNVIPAMLAIALLGVAVAIVAESGLAILGVGVKADSTHTSWGQLINIGRNSLSDAPFLVFIPAFVLFLTVMSLNYIGDIVRARFDVKVSAL